MAQALPCAAPSYLPLLAALLGALTGAGIAFLTTRWSLNRANHLSRERERQRDDRIHKRAMLLDRSERQREAVGKLEDFAAKDPRLDGNAESVRVAIAQAFGDPLLAEQCVDHAIAAWSEKDDFSHLIPRKELEADIETLSRLTHLTREEAGEPPFPDWRPIRLQMFKRLDDKLEGLLSTLTEEMERQRRGGEPEEP